MRPCDRPTLHVHVRGVLIYTNSATGRLRMGTTARPASPCVHAADKCPELERVSNAHLTHTSDEARESRP